MPAKDMGRTDGQTTSGDDMHGMLGQMAEQIADAERRHRDQMRAMQQRLAELTSDVAPAMAPALTDDAWDAATAEALTRMYETEAPEPHDAAPAFFLQDPLPVAPAVKAPAVKGTVAPEASNAPATAPAAHPAHDIVRPMKIVVADADEPAPDHDEPLASLARDRSWLDERIEDIAARVEETLARNNPLERIADLDRRFGLFEESFGQAMAGVATRADVEGLQTIQSQIGDLAMRLEETRSSLRRIDGVESELRKLSAFAEQAQMVDTDPAAGPHAMPDVATLVDTAADRVAERFASLAPRGTPAAFDTTRLDEMQALLATIAEERRREEHQTSSMLDTMQEALVRLIDRVDQIDPLRMQATDAMGAPFVAEPPHQPASDVVYVENERGPNPGRRASDHEAYVQSDVRHHAPELPPERLDMPATAAAGYAPTAADPIDELTERPAVMLRPVRAAAQIHPEVQPQPQPQPQPHAQPQRARPLEHPAAAAPATKPVPPRATRQMAQPTVIAMPDEAKADETEPQPSTLAKRGIMVAGIGVAIIALGLMFEFFIKDRLLSNGAPKLAERAPVARQPQPVPAAQPQGPAMTPRFVDEPETPTPAAVRQPADGQPTQPDPREAPVPLQGRGASDQPPLNQQPRPRSQLETSTGQPPQAVGLIPQAAPAASASRVGAPPPATTSVQGIALQHPAPVQIPAAMVPQAPKPTAQAPSPITTASLPKAVEPPQAAIELPPALIGPLSLRLAAQKGDPEAQFEVAARFAEGKGVKQDFKQALTWYDRSARAGFVPSQYRLGTLFERGVGGSPDVATARYWYERAATEGNTKAMHNLAVVSASAQNGQSPDYATAIQWFTAAAERGLADSQFNLGVLFENGLGVDRDPAAAYKWYALAAAKGDAEATRRRDAVVARLKPAEARALAEEVANWRAKPVNLAANDARIAGATLRARAEQAAAAAAQTPEASVGTQPQQPARRPDPAKRAAPKPAAQTSFN